MFWKRKPQYRPIELQSQTKARAVIELFWMFIWRRHDPLEVAARLLEFFRDLKWSELIEVDQGLRKYSYYNLSETRNADPSSFFVEGLSVEFQNSFFLLSTFAPSGYFREKALIAVEEFTRGEEIPFLLIRLTDWVLPVRRRAERAILRRVRPEYSRAFVKNYGIVEGVRKSTRTEGAEFWALLDSFLRDDPRNSYEFLSSVSDEARVRNSLIRRLVLTRSMKDEELVDLFKRERESSLRFHILEKILAGKEAENLPLLLELIKEKSSQKCKTILLHRIAKFGYPLIETFLYECLFSRSTSMRRTSRFLISTHTDVDFHGIYLRALFGDHNRSTVISALAEVGTSADCVHILPFVRSATEAVRKAAIEAVSKLAAPDLEPLVLDLLRDQSVSVSYAARKAIIRSQIFVPLSEVEKIFNSEVGRNVRLNCLQVLVSASKWDSVYYMVKYLESEPAIADFCRQRLGKWNWQYNRSYTTPSSEQIIRIEEVLKDLDNSSSTKDVKDLEFALRVFRH